MALYLCCFLIAHGNWKIGYVWTSSMCVALGSILGGVECTVLHVSSYERLKPSGILLCFDWWRAIILDFSRNDFAIVYFVNLTIYNPWHMISDRVIDVLKELKVYPNMESHGENILESIWRCRKQETGISRAIYDHGVRGLLVSGCISWYILKGKSNLFWSLSSEHQLYWWVSKCGTLQKKYWPPNGQVLSTETVFLFVIGLLD